MRNITTPTKAVSFEDALRNLAAKLTGKPAASLPRTQEAVVQYIADNISSVKELTDAIVQEVMDRLAPAGTEAAQDGPEDEPEDSDATGTKEAPKGRKRKPNTN